ncbi:MAG: transglutaminase domain-containing protein [Phycisphaerales bacterium]
MQTQSANTLEHDSKKTAPLSLHARASGRSLKMLGVAALVGIQSFTAGEAIAQSSSHPDSVSPLKPNPYIKHQDPWRWDVRTQVFLRAGFIGRFNGEFREELSGSWDIENFQYIFPLVRQGGHYWTPNEEFTTSLRIDDDEYVPEPEVLFTEETRSPYLWWRSNAVTDHVNQLHVIQTTHVVSASTKFDESKAKQIPWPDSWSTEATKFLAPIIDRVDKPIDTKGQDRLIELLDQWIEGNDPKSIDQVTLAKFLTGKVIEHVRIVHGSIASRASSRVLFNQEFRDGLTNLSNGFSGLAVRSADQIALEPAGSRLDLSSMLTSVLRAAGIPARTVVCYNNNVFIEEGDRIQAIVEFALYDEQNDQILWIPIDVEKLLDNGRRSAYYEQPWDYFGNHDELNFYVPLAHYFHPQANYQAYAFPGLYGFRAQPDIGNRVTQRILIEVNNTASRGDDPVRKP